MIKMIVVDLDDTLLRTDKTISAYTKEVLQKVREKGVKTAFATARGAISIERFIPLELFDARINMSGACAFIDNECVYDRTIAPALMEPFLQKLTELGLAAAAEIDSVHYANFDVYEKWPYIHDFQISDFSCLPGNAYKLYAVIKDPQQVETITPLIAKELYFVVSKDNLLMVMHKEATKMNAIDAVAKVCGIARSEIAAFGDDILDIEMLSLCGTGIAMENALDEVKQVADYICPSNDEDGVAKWLDEHLL